MTRQWQKVVNYLQQKFHVSTVIHTHAREREREQNHHRSRKHYFSKKKKNGNQPGTEKIIQKKRRENQFEASSHWLILNCFVATTCTHFFLFRSVMAWFVCQVFDSQWKMLPMYIEFIYFSVLNFFVVPGGALIIKSIYTAGAGVRWQTRETSKVKHAHTKHTDIDLPATTVFF